MATQSTRSEVVMTTALAERGVRKRSLGRPFSLRAQAKIVRRGSAAISPCRSLLVLFDLCWIVKAFEPRVEAPAGDAQEASGGRFVAVGTLQGCAE
jgi:hypothetical protein